MYQVPNPTAPTVAASPAICGVVRPKPPFLLNKICSNYGKSYEKLVNLYVGDINGYNTKISEYNSYKNATISMFNMVHLEYIDYNEDGVYEGVIENETH